MKKAPFVSKKRHRDNETRAGLTINSRPLGTLAEARAGQFTRVWLQDVLPPLRVPCPTPSVWSKSTLPSGLTSSLAKWIPFPSLLPRPSWCHIGILDHLAVNDDGKLETTARSPLFHSQDLTKGLAPPKSMLEKSLESLDRMIDRTSVPSSGNFVWCVLQVWHLLNNSA